MFFPLPGKLEKLRVNSYSPICGGRESNGCSLFLARGSAAVEAGKLDIAKDLLQINSELPAPIRVCLLRPTGKSVAFGTRDERH